MKRRTRLWFQRMKLTYAKLRSSFSIKLKQRHYNEAFDNFIIVLILVSSMLLAIDSPKVHPDLLFPSTFALNQLD